MIVAQILDKIDENQEHGRSNVRPITETRQSSMLIADSSEYMEGEAAFCSGLTTRNNPYPFLSPEYWRWQEGLLGNCRPRESQVNPEENSYRLVEVGPHLEDVTGTSRIQIIAETLPVPIAAS
jgi:hypothetical protein